MFIVLPSLRLTLLSSHSKTVGPEAAIRAILQATYEALAQVDGYSALSVEELLSPPALDRQVFKKVWLGLAGILHQADIDAFAPFAREAFHISAEDDDALRITNGESELVPPGLQTSSLTRLDFQMDICSLPLA